MTVRPIGHDFRPLHILPRRHFAVRPLVCPFPETRSFVAGEVVRAIENRPQPPFSLSGTVSYIAFSHTFYRFVAGELLLPLLLRLRAEWSHLYPPRFDFDGSAESTTGVPIATQQEAPPVDDRAQRNAGGHLNLIA